MDDLREHGERGVGELVLEDDRLITKLAVQTDRLLEPIKSSSEVELTVLVRTKTLVQKRALAGIDNF